MGPFYVWLIILRVLKERKDYHSLGIMTPDRQALMHRNKIEFCKRR